jgi:Fe-S cluster biogenesis protein NfuA
VAARITGGYGIREKVQEILDRIRPAVQADGGDIELVDIEDGVVKLMLQGACVGCSSSLMTIRMGIEQRLIDEIPEVTEVVAL